MIIGQDPYHGPGQAHGLCFSVNDGVPFPPSLLNIFKEIKNDIGTDAPTTGNLTRWAEQGILLLNATLTVRAHQAGSHQNRGWETFTDAAIRIPGVTEKCAGQGKGSVQSSGSSFEELTWITYDAIVMDLMRITKQGDKELFARHANME